MGAPLKPSPTRPTLSLQHPLFPKRLPTDNGGKTISLFPLHLSNPFVQPFWEHMRFLTTVEESLKALCPCSGYTHSTEPLVWWPFSSYQNDSILPPRPSLCDYLLLFLKGEGDTVRLCEMQRAVLQRCLCAGPAS